MDKLGAKAPSLWNYWDSVAGPTGIKPVYHININDLGHKTMYNNVQHSLKCTMNVQHFRPVVHHISTAGLPPYQPTGSSPEHIASIQSQGQQRASEIVDSTRRVSDCEELVGAVTVGDGVGCGVISTWSIKITRKPKLFFLYRFLFSDIP